MPENTGFISNPENTGVIDRPRGSRDFIAGWVTTLPQEPMNLSGNWRPFLPTYEPQHNGVVETMGCVSFTALNVLEILLRFLYGTEEDFSDRALAKMSGTTKRGNWFTNVWDALRHKGAVDEELWPFEANTWEEYYKDIPEHLKAEALRFSGRYDIGYEFLPWINAENLREGLKRSPLQVAIGKDQEPSYHSLTLVDVDSDGRRWVFDSYPDPTSSGNEKKGLYVLPEHLNINAALIGYIEKVKPEPMPNIKLPNDCLVAGILDHGIVQALHLNGKLLIDPDDKNQALRQWFMRNEDNGFFKGGPVRTVSKEDFESFPLQDFKGNSIS